MTGNCQCLCKEWKKTLKVYLFIDIGERINNLWLGMVGGWLMLVVGGGWGWVGGGIALKKLRCAIPPQLLFFFFFGGGGGGGGGVSFVPTLGISALCLVITLFMLGRQL